MVFAGVEGEFVSFPPPPAKKAPFKICLPVAGHKLVPFPGTAILNENKTPLEYVNQDGDVACRELIFTHHPSKCPVNP
jgi:hypothetical protein